MRYKIALKLSKLQSNGHLKSDETRLTLLYLKNEEIKALNFHVQLLVEKKKKTY